MIVAACSLQLPHELGICKNHRNTNQFKNVVGRGQLNLFSVTLSSHASQLDALSFHVLDTVNRRMCSVRSRYNVFMCRSLVIPSRGSEIPILKTSVAALSRYYNAFHGSPFVLQLVPGLVIIVFALWGLAPLVCHARNLFHQRSDNNWKRSSAHYVTTSYLRPMLLWTGATLVCRALDPVVLSSEVSQSVKQRVLVFVRSLSTVLAFAYCLSSLIQQTQRFFMETNDSSDARNMGFQFAGKAVYSAVWVAAVSLFMELLGFSTQKMLTAGGLGTVLLTLSGREIFTNFLSSMMIHATRPFVLNEWIQTKIEGYEVSGTVEHVGWWSPTIIRGDDREAVHIPNHKFTVNVVRNLSQKTHWRIKTHFAISHLDVNKINHIVADMRKVLAKNPQLEQKRLHRRVFLETVDPENQALMVLVSCFVKTSHIEEYFCVKEATLLDLLRVISHHGARLATPIRTVQKRHSDADMENIPFSETIFTRTGAATNHPFLLIEPPYKINSDDKMKAHAHSARSHEEQDTQVISLTSDAKVSKATAKPSDLKADTQVGDTALDSEAGSETDYEVTTISQSKFDDTAIATKSSLPDSKVDPKFAATFPDLKNWGMSEIKVDYKVATTSSNSREESQAAATLLDLKKHGPAPSGLDQKNSDMQLEKLSSVNSRVNTSRVDDVPVGTLSSTPSNSQVKVLDSMGLNSRDSKEVEGIPLATTHAKQETERLPISPPPQTRSTLEDNIVLGVALEGSKRTLPIEESVTPSPTHAEMKELAACRNGNGNDFSAAAKDNNDGQILAVPGDQRGQER